MTDEDFVELLKDSIEELGIILLKIDHGSNISDFNISFIADTKEKIEQIRDMHHSFLSSVRENYFQSFISDPDSPLRAKTRTTYNEDLLKFVQYNELYAILSISDNAPSIIIQYPERKLSNSCDYAQNLMNSRAEISNRETSKAQDIMISMLEKGHDITTSAVYAAERSQAYMIVLPKYEFLSEWEKNRR